MEGLFGLFNGLSWPLVLFGGFLGIVIFRNIMASTKKKTKKQAPRKASSGTKKPRSTAQKKPAAKRTSAPKQANTQAERNQLYEKLGAEGEQNIYNVLVQLVGPQSVFKNVYVRRPSGRLTEIDLLAVHTTGVYVIESKNYSGMVIGDGNSEEWAHIRGSYNRSFYSPVLQNAGHIDALRAACQQHVGFVPPMLSVLVFPDKCELQIKGLPNGLRCCRLAQLAEVLRSCASQVRPMLNAANVQTLNSLFYQSQRDMLPASVKEQHKKDVAAARAWAKNK